ncbi:hypothetical protein [uncultured Paracoccus sp.]|uniref:hypothetical protein n=1 Tax=uncultured Paracoccus sp. TaxID=189685 RepID=UPI00260CACB6|nr:hypothetical protein [uncultured Paracoccus sp.]
MTDTLDPGPADPLANCRFGCSPAPIDPAPPPSQRPSAARSAAAAPVIGTPDPVTPVPRQRPEFLLRADPAWRRACLEASAHIPSGYTYLGQLMGHDMGCSVPLSAVPHSTRGEVIGAVSVLGPRRYNLIDNPLTLETIYGPGPTMLSHVYDPDQMLFRLTPGARLARVYRLAADSAPGGDRQPLRALYDERNRDSLMLHELSVAWMQFHNLCARRLMAEGMRPFPAYVAVRNHAVRVWHGIVTGDILPRFLHPEIAALPALPDEWHLDEATLLHGLFRAFHALPLAGYHLGRSGTHNLRAMLRTGFDHSEAELDWSIDWDLFFGAKPGGPKTGLSASVAPELRHPATAAAVIAMDADSAREAEPLRAGNDRIEAAIAKLPAPWPARLAAGTITPEFNTRFPASPVTVTTQMIEWGPLFQTLMIEAQLHGVNGGFGPLGSALLRGSIEGSIARVQLTTGSRGAQGLPHPATMLELIATVRKG